MDLFGPVWVFWKSFVYFACWRPSLSQTITLFISVSRFISCLSDRPLSPLPNFLRSSCRNSELLRSYGCPPLPLKFLNILSHEPILFCTIFTAIRAAYLGMVEHVALSWRFNHFSCKASAKCPAFSTCSIKSTCMTKNIWWGKLRNIYISNSKYFTRLPWQSSNLFIGFVTHAQSACSECNVHAVLPRTMRKVPADCNFICDISTLTAKAKPRS